MKQILIRPIITEKSMARLKNNQYTFEVVPGVNKHEIADNVEKEYKVHVVEIKTLTRKGKIKKSGKKRMTRQLASRKFAIVKLKQGEKIDAFQQ